MRTLVLITVLLFGGRAVAGNPVAARALYKRGIEEFKAKKYGEASITLLKSYEMDPKPDTLFALAQAERFDNRCNDAVEHYKKLLDQNTDLPTAKAIQLNIDLCVTDKANLPEKPVVCETKPPPRADEPKPRIETRTIVRTESRVDKLGAALLGGGALGVGGSIALFLASASSGADSDAATNVAEANRLYDRSRTQRLLAFVSGGVGVALITVGVLKVMKRKPTKTEVAMTYSNGFGVALATRW